MSFYSKAWSTNILVLILFGVDRILKIYYINNPGVVRVFISDMLIFHLQYNQGIAFGIKIPLIIIIPLIVSIIIALTYILVKSYQSKEFLSYLAFLFIIVGAVSNFIDRIKFNHVIDYIDIPFFTVFNLADSMIILGVVILLIDRILLFLKKS